MKPFTSKHCTPINYGSPLHDNHLKKRGRVLHENFYGEGLKNVNTLNQTSSGNITVEDRDWKNKKVNDPRGVLNRPMTNKEHSKGYKVKREKDGSVTLRGRKGNKK